MSARRPQIAFFDFDDVFEDFYPHYGVTQEAFARRWAATGNHAWVTLLQREIGDVTWFVTSLAPEVDRERHAVTGAAVRVLPSSWLHRRLWHGFYATDQSWRWQHRHRAYGTAASYLAPLSRPLLGALRALRPDLVVLQDYATGRFDVLAAAARVLGARVAAYHSGSVLDEHYGAPLRRHTLGLADRLLVSSAAEADALVRRYGVARERLATVLTPIDTSVFCPNGHAPDGPPRALYLGRLDDDVKRVSAIIRAVAALPAGELVVAGVGPDRAKLEALAADVAPGRVRFTGWVRDDDVPALLCASDVLVLASRREGFPTVVGQALACGTPVVATRVGGVAELVRDGETGWLVEPGDDAALARALGAALGGAARAMRGAARAVAEERVAPAAVARRLRAALPIAC